MPEGLKKGDVVGIPCDVGRGAFPGECLITVEATSGPVSGFVPASQLTNIERNRGYVRATVEAVTFEIITVWIDGSFFTTTGLADLPANSKLERVEAC